MPTRRQGRPDHGWTFVTSHLVVLLCIAEDPTVRIAEVAEQAGITQRAVQGIIADLVEAGYLTRTRVGRRNQYAIKEKMPLRHLQTQHKRLGDLLSALAPEAEPRDEAHVERMRKKTSALSR
jgi:DNA-binding IclR family transcriptional regulator